MKIDKYQYCWPPRPEKPVPVDFLSFYQKRGWLAQYKKNGACTVIFVSPEKEITAKNRHNGDHKSWSFGPKTEAFFKELPGDGWYVFVAELLNGKVNGISDILYIFDTLAVDGEYLLGKTFEERYEIGKQLFLDGSEKDDYSHWWVNDNLQFAKCFSTKFKQRWHDCNDSAPASGNPLDEGLVMKKADMPLSLCNNKSSNSSGQVKCRISHKNYGF